MCGFTDVQRTHDGEYFCSICGRKLGKDFWVITERSLTLPERKIYRQPPLAVLPAGVRL